MEDNKETKVMETKDGKKVVFYEDGSIEVIEDATDNAEKPAEGAQTPAPVPANAPEEKKPGLFGKTVAFVKKHKTAFAAGGGLLIGWLAKSGYDASHTEIEPVEDDIIDGECNEVFEGNPTDED